jgi:hypothetical protein
MLDGEVAAGTTTDEYQNQLNEAMALAAKEADQNE